MTPELHIKLSEQVARQAPEALALEPQIAAMQPAIDSAQAWVDSCQASATAAQAALDAVASIEGADATEQQDAFAAATQTLEAAKSDLSALTEPRDALAAKLAALRASIAHCQGLIDAGGLSMTQDELTSIQLGRARAQVWEHIKAHRDKLAESGCKVGANWFHNDIKSRGQWERMVNRVDKEGLADSAPYTIAGYPVAWKTLTGDKVILTAGIIRSVVAMFEIQEAMIFGAAEAHRAAVNASASPLAYDYSAGWPAGFTG